jgi:hypothetical protein
MEPKLLCSECLCQQDMDEYPEGDLCPNCEQGEMTLYALVPVKEYEDLVKAGSNGK